MRNCETNNCAVFLKAGAWILLLAAMLSASLVIAQSGAFTGWVFYAVPGMIFGFICAIISMYALSEGRSWNPFLAASAAFLAFLGLSLVTIPCIAILVVALILVRYNCIDRIKTFLRRIFTKKLTG